MKIENYLLEKLDCPLEILKYLGSSALFSSTQISFRVGMVPQHAISFAAILVAVANQSTFKSKDDKNPL